jgi:hypothetical protein
MIELQGYGIPKNVCCLRKPTIMWLCSHLSFRKCWIITKMSTSTLDIQRSKDTMQEWHYWRVNNTNLSLVYFAILGKTLVTKARLDGKTRQGFCFLINLLAKGASTKDKGINSLAMSNAKSSSNYFQLRSYLLWVSSS